MEEACDFYALRKPFIVSRYFTLHGGKYEILEHNNNLFTVLFVSDETIPGIEKSINITYFITEYDKYRFKSDKFFIFDGNGLNSYNILCFSDIKKSKDKIVEWKNFRFYGAKIPEININKCLYFLIARDTLKYYPGYYITDKEAHKIISIRVGAYKKNNIIYYNNGLYADKINNKIYRLLPYGDKIDIKDTKFGHLTIYENSLSYKLNGEFGYKRNFLHFIKNDSDMEYLNNLLGDKNIGVFKLIINKVVKYILNYKK